MNEENQTLIKKENTLSIVAFGCSIKAYEKISNFLREKNILSFNFYEYFLQQPLHRKDTLEGLAFAPYLQRTLAKSDLCPDIDKINNLTQDDFGNINFSTLFNFGLLKPKTLDLLRKISTTNKLKKEISDTEIGKELFSGWKDNKFKCYSENKMLAVANVEGDWLISYLRKDYLKGLQKEDLEYARQTIKGYLTFDLHWALSGKSDDKIHYISFSISSKNIFYGYLIILLPSVEDNSIYEGLKKIVELEIIGKYYLPVLTLFENHWLEHQIGNLSNSESEKIRKFLSLRGDVIFLKGNDNDWDENTLEGKTHNLWKNRKKMVAKREFNVKNFKKTLIFKKFIIASPGMVDTIINAINLNITSANGEEIPAILIFGPPGSGKEKLSQMISLFTPNFFNAKIYPVNLSSIQPKQIAPSLILGLELKENISFPGILKKIYQNIGKEDKERNAVLILDELNSLDVDVQGSLLRFIENSEIVPIGGIGDEKEIQRKLFIIGLMNEDPQKLTKESYLSEILRGNMLSGGILGEVLYEYVRKLRRLREDLYYRMIRGGKIEIPELRKRREDIPILFYLFCQDELKLKAEESLYVEFEVYEKLMSEELNWPGNVRQLQSVAKGAVRAAKKIDENVYIITMNDIKSVLEEQGLIKEEEKLVPTTYH